ncbi:hypothetical protein DSO57_1031842 [Entomophthora muscae]|uniref:Uncharacterized protein n=1 Tax=Entomophthora muscae TaxID=34485 RepID=A0ACC2SDH0_9FUNG|nr:hypothetical protein DSO57_1031842 [Entomophthora muscae]
MAQEKIFVAALHHALYELPGDVRAFWRLAQEPDLSVYKSSQAFCLLGASKNDSSPFCLRFAQDPTYDPTIEEMVDAFSLVLYGQDPLAEDLDWLAEIGNQFGSWQESSTVSANRQLAQSLSQGHQSLPYEISAGAGTSPVVLTLSRALQMQQFSLHSLASRGLCRPLELVSASPICQKLNVFVPFPEEIKHLIRQLWSLYLQQYDVQQYMETTGLTQVFQKVLCYTLESKTFLVTFSSHQASPCGKVYCSNGSYLVWKDISNLLIPVNVKVGENSSHTSHVPGFGKLMHLCHDEVCGSRAVEVLYYRDQISYECPTNIMLPDWVYTLCEFFPAVTCDFLIQRLFGRTSSVRSDLTDPSDKNLSFGIITENHPSLGLIGSPKIDFQSAVVASFLIDALKHSNDVDNSFDFKLAKTCPLPAVSADSPCSSSPVLTGE